MSHRLLAQGVADYLAGNIEPEVVARFQENVAILPWFQSVDARELTALVTRATRGSSAGWYTAWKWTKAAPGSLYSRSPCPLPDLLGSLVRLRSADWPEQMGFVWSDILRRSQAESESDRTQLLLYVQALKFALGHTQLPLGAVVAEAFHFVYSAVTESASFARETAPMFGMFDWDKGKELRRQLVECFYNSKWPPGDLIIASSDTRLVRKILKRLLKKPHGHQYAQTAIADLDTRDTEKTVALAGAMRDLLAQPNYYEDWE